MFNKRLLAVYIVVFLCLIGPFHSASAQTKQPVLDAKTRLQFHRQHLKMREASQFNDLSWQHIGPLLMSGRITDIAVPLDRKYTFYVASASGGVWKTENEGTTWQPIFDDAPSASVGAIAVAPSQTDTVWVGLGEANIFRSSMAGTGVYKSPDGGKTWKHQGLADTQHIARIVIDPKNPDVVYVAACGHEYTDNKERGVYRTRDGGKTWTKVLYENEKTGAIDLVIDPANPQVLYASMWDRIRYPWSDPKPRPGGGIYKTTDGGTTWRKLTKGLPPQATTGRTGLTISRSNPKVVYAILDNHQVARKARPGERDAYGRPRKDVIKGAEVYRSDDAGDSWRKVSRGGRLMTRLFSTYGWVFGQLRVDPNDENTVYVLGVSMLKSTDGGKTFSQVGSVGLHADHHALWIDPRDSKHVISGNDGGINISYDAARTWKNLENLGIVQFYNVAYDMAKPFNVYGSIQDNGSWSGPVTHQPGRSRPNEWQRIPGGEASYHAIDPTDPNVLYSEAFYGRIQRSTLKPRRTNRIAPKAARDQPPLRGQWLAPFTISKHNPFVIYHGMQYVFRSVNRGDSWERISPDLTDYDKKKQGDISYATISSLSESPLKFGLLYAGTDDGRLHRRDDNGKWTEIGKSLPRQWVSRVVASAYNEATVYVALNGKRDDDFAAYLYQSTDYGKTWKDISLNVPGGPINVVKEDPAKGNLLYLGTDLGVYASLNKGADWEVLGSNLPITFVHDLIVHPRDQIMVIATHGRGMWKLDVKTVQAAAK